MILSHLFDFILPTDIFYFVKHPAVKKEVLRVRTVCKLWDQILKKILPIKKHLKIEKSCCNNEPGKGKILEESIPPTHTMQKHLIITSHSITHLTYLLFSFPIVSFLYLTLMNINIASNISILCVKPNFTSHIHS